MRLTAGSTRWSRYHLSLNCGVLLFALRLSPTRPFTQSQVTSSERVIPLGSASPPSYLLSAHDNILVFRNKVIGHKDATPARGHSDTPNIVLVKINARGFGLSAVITADLETELREQVRKLCVYFVAHCDSKLDPLIERYGHEVMRRPPGRYQLHKRRPRRMD